MKNKIQKLKFRNKIEIIPTIPFHFDSTFYKPAHFPTADTMWQPGKRWQTMCWQGEKLGLIFVDKSSHYKPKILVQIYAGHKLTKDFLNNLKKEIIWRYNLDLDLRDFYQAMKKETKLKQAIKKFHGLRPMHPGSLYEYLVISIVLQNATIRRTVKMMQVLFDNYGSQIEFARRKFWCFWQPEILAKASEKKLRKLKLGYRAKFLIRVSQSFLKENINEAVLRGMIQGEQEELLLNLYGIGPASVGYIMFDVFHHWDYLKHISPWEQKIYTKIFFNRDFHKKLVAVDKMIKHFDQWGRWKGLAIHYLWEDLWWQRRNKHISWLEELIRL